MLLRFTQTIFLTAIVLAVSIQNNFAATFTAVQFGNWNTASTWDMGSVPQAGDNVIVPQGLTVYISSNQNLGDDQVEIYGTLQFTNGSKLNLAASGVIYIVGQGQITCSANGNSCSSARISIDGDNKWQGTDGPVVGDRAINAASQASNSPNFQTPIPPQALLPIELLYFEAEVKESSAVEVRWATATEVNNEYFAVQRSNDGQNWNTIAEVEGALNSQRTITYSIKDLKAASGNNFYRLVQFDTDGDYSISKTVVVKKTAQISSSVYPNPSQGRFHFTVQSTDQDNQTIKVYNANGQLVEQVAVMDALTTVDLTNDQAGTYFYQIDNGQEITQTGMIIKK